MKEEFLYHLWKFQKFNSDLLFTSENESLTILNPGSHNDLSGPDFFNAKIQIGDQLWAGNVEIHIRSSDWYLHHHETDIAYDNVILHVVWEHDAEVYRKDEQPIPCLELKNRIDEGVIENYKNLLEKKHFRINCENEFESFTNFQLNHWLERLYFERLEQKSKFIFEILERTGNNWEETLFQILCRSFGSKINADSFSALASGFDFKILQKLSGNCLAIEALFLGQAGLIKTGDLYADVLLKEYEFLKRKYSLKDEFLESPKFFRLRPDNFPTIRLAQLAALYSERSQLFADLIIATDLKSIRKILRFHISDYWKSHYNFGKEHPEKSKFLSADFIDLLVINCIVPIKHCYFKFIGEENEEQIHQLINSVKPEKNSVIKIFEELKPGIANSAMDSQALLQLKNEYCNLNKCLQCELGASLLRKSPKYI